MTDLHDRFREWLLSGAPDDPPRGAALHASACDRCLSDIASLDALFAVDVAGATVPALPVGAKAAIHPPALGVLRVMGGVTAAALLVVAVMVGAGALREGAADPAVAGDPVETPAGEGILAGMPSFAPATPGETRTPSPSASAGESAGASEQPAESEVASGLTPTQPPFVAPPPPPITPGPTPAVTPQPTTAATAAPTTPPTSGPTPVPSTPPPLPTPTPAPLPTPPPSEAPIPTPAPPTPTPTPSEAPPP